MKKYLISSFHHYLHEEPDFPRVMRCALQCHLEMRYLERGRILDIPSPSIGFVVSGLLKEYIRAARGRPNLMQLIAMGEAFVYAPQKYANKCIALEPTWILHLALKDLATLFPSHPSVGEWVYSVWVKHEVRHALPFFLQDLPDKQERLALFRTEFGRYMEYLSTHEVSQYLGVDDKTCRKVFGDLF